MLIEVKDESHFKNIVSERGNGKIYHASKSYGTSVGNKPAPKTKHTYLYLTHTGTFVHKKTIESSDSSELLLDFNSDDVIELEEIKLPSERIILK